MNEPIDGIFISHGLTTQASGYYKFGGAAPSSHCPLWVNIAYYMVFVERPPKIHTITARGPKNEDPQVVKRSLSSMPSVSMKK
jgi:hypothetical protein